MKFIYFFLIPRSKVPKWKCAHILLCKKYKNCLKLLNVADLQKKIHCINIFSEKYLVGGLMLIEEWGAASAVAARASQQPGSTAAAAPETVRQRLQPAAASGGATRPDTAPAAPALCQTLWLWAGEQGRVIFADQDRGQQRWRWWWTRCQEPGGNIGNTETETSAAFWAILTTYTTTNYNTA